MKYLIGIFCISFVATILLGSCDSYKQQEEKVEPQQTDNPNTEVFEFPIKKFSIPYDTSLKCDSNSLIFLKQVPFDTSYLLHISRQGSKMRGICYIVLPSYHRDLEDFYDEEHQLLFFDGFSFRLDAIQWEMLRKKTDEAIMKMTDSSRNDSPCFDCPSYSVFHNNKKRATGNSKLQGNFKAYDVFIRDSLINHFLTKKKSNTRVK